MMLLSSVGIVVSYFFLRKAFLAATNLESSKYKQTL